MAALRIGEMFGSMMTVTEGAFALKPITEPTVNGSLGAARLLQRRRPAADRGRAHCGIWLSSTCRPIEDEFWGSA
ncbi:hypothetical protein [Streptomyces luteogriseus]|uniref:hypothetical protein n=1 Tax=Streptomyces luteogriseus TaxID=68233 RepID=UPI00382CCE0A